MFHVFETQSYKDEQLKVAVKMIFHILNGIYTAGSESCDRAVLGEPLSRTGSLAPRDRP